MDKAVYESVYYYVYFGIPVLFAHIISYLAWGIAAERISIRLRGLLYSSIIKQDLNWFETFNSEETNALYAYVFFYYNTPPPLFSYFKVFIYILKNAEQSKN